MQGKVVDGSADFFYTMALHFSDTNLIFLCNEMTAAVFKGDRDWNWRKEQTATNKGECFQLRPWAANDKDTAGL